MTLLNATAGRAIGFPGDPCPRCGGSMLLEPDGFTAYRICLRCHEGEQEASSRRRSLSQAILLFMMRG